MSSTLTVRAFMEAPNTGGEVSRIESTRQMPLPLAEVWSNTVLMGEGGVNTDGGQASPWTLWDASQGGNPTTWQAMGIFVDPDQENVQAQSTPGSLTIQIEIQVNATVLVFTVEPMAPLLFTNQGADTAIQTNIPAVTQPPTQPPMRYTINRVRAANYNALTTGPVGQNNLKVRIVLYN